MLDWVISKWDENKKNLVDAIRCDRESNTCEYIHIVKLVDGLKREIKEETGLSVKSIQGEKSAIITEGESFTMECIRPFSAYQTLEGPVDSFGIHFICEVEGELLTTGDDTADIHWATKKDVKELIGEHKFSEIDLPAVLMFLRDEN